MDDDEQQMTEVLDTLLASDENITARAVARLHPGINAASSITRSEKRSKLLAEYQARQLQYRVWRGRVGKRSGAEIVAELESQQSRIATLERHIEILLASHVAIIRSVGSVGGFNKWAEFFESYQHARDALASLGATPVAEVTDLLNMPAKPFPRNRGK